MAFTWMFMDFDVFWLMLMLFSLILVDLELS